MAFKENGLSLDDLFSVKVDDIPHDCRKEDLEDAFSKFGVVQDA